jgi:hypothetical protein
LGSSIYKYGDQATSEYLDSEEEIYARLKDTCGRLGIDLSKEYTDDEIEKILLKASNGKTYRYLLEDKDGNRSIQTITLDENGKATCNHDHTASGYETTDIDGDGDVDSDVLKEDKQAVYIPFNQLFGGYGWGVNGVDLDEYNADTEEGNKINITVVTNPVVKFNIAETVKDSYETETTINVGELFTSSATDIDTDNVQVFVSPAVDLDPDSTASGTYAANTTDWTKGTVTFTGAGTATITITDYYFCTPTTITVEIIEKQNDEKFEKKFTGDFLYRVGNQNAVDLGSLFKVKDGETIGTVEVDVTSVEGSSVSGTYTQNNTWTKGTIQFAGTGVAKISITSDDSEPT